MLMSKFCPELNRKVLYMECLECDSKSCNAKPLGINKNLQNKANYIKNNPEICGPVSLQPYISFKKELDKDKEYINTLFDEEQYDKLETEIAKRLSKLSYMITKADSEKNKSLIIGQYAEYLLSIRNRLTDIYLRKSFVDYINSCSISEIIIVCKIIIKASQGIYSPDEMSRDNPLEKEKFDIIDKLHDLGVIAFSRPGAYRYLHLTRFGKDSYKKNKVIVDYLGS